MKGNVKCPGDLASFFSNQSGSSILSHGYSQYGLPTFFHSDIVFGNNNETELTALRRVTPADFARSIGFLQMPRPAVNEVRIQPAGICETDPTHQVSATFDSVFNRQSTDNAPENTPHFEKDFILFSEDKHLFPHVYVLNPTDPTTVDAWKVTCFGMVIESMDIDGTVIPLPNTQLSLGIENSWFADSCIPIRYTFRATNFKSAPDTCAYPRRRIISERQTRFPAASLLVDRTKVNLPRAAATTAAISSDASVFAGLTSLPNVTWLRMVQSFLGFRTSDARSHSSTSDNIPGMKADRLLLWSPYTYVGYEGEDDFTVEHESTKIYFISNLRTLYGTRIPLVEVKSALESMPIF